jgi:cell division protein FtsI (penicillin-binding protein 3)
MPVNPARLFLLIAIALLWTGGILLRLSQLQIFQHEEFVQRALQRQQITKSVLAPRGFIYDSQMHELATSVTAGTVVAEPRRIQDRVAAARRLASILQLDDRDLLRRFTDPKRQSYQVVKRRIDPGAEARIEALGIDGVYLIEESMRVYPHLQLASHVLGFVNMNGDGGAGLELQYDRELKGTQGLVSFDVDARQRSFRGQVINAPVPGRSLILSINQSIQYIAQRELAAGVKEAGAAAGVAIVMESDTGRILALANYPDFNSNTYNQYPADRWRNRAVSDLFEPGSTFKVVVASAALEAGLTRADEIIDCQMGTIVIGRHAFHDHHPYGLLTFSEVLELSSNVGAAKLGLRLGEQRLYEALRTFGFGSRTEIDLPGEIVGLVRDWRSWSGLSIGAISFGQEVGVTSAQILTAINAIANGGYRVRPSVVDRIVDQNGDLVSVRPPERTRIMQAKTAEAIQNAFEGVVLRGTGKKAALEGYRAAGKTGTAQKIVDGRYSNSKYLASFIGFAPLPRPRISILVQLDEPRRSIYGGEVSSPIFQRIAQETLLQLRVPPDPTVPLPSVNPKLASKGTEDYLPNATPVVPAKHEPVEEDKTADIRVAIEDADTVLMPDFRGMSKRQVVSICLEMRIPMRAKGSGFAVEQTPLPGTRVPQGETCSVTFARERAAAGNRSGSSAVAGPVARNADSRSETRQ